MSNSSHLDSILDRALEEFDFEDLSIRGSKDNESVYVDSFIQNKEAERRRKEEALRLLDNLNDPNFGSTLKSTLTSLSQTSKGNEQVDDLFDNLASQYNKSSDNLNFIPNDEHDIEGVKKADDVVAATLEMFSKAQQGMEGFDTTKMEEVGEDMMEDMMAQFEALGEKEDYNDVIDGVMKQLLSRNLMYEPTKQICEKFPEWLAIHKSKLSEADYTNYGLQYQAFQKLLAVYDTEPDNFPRLMELMFDLQKYGQPPADIIKDLAPGLQFDENGIPIMPNMGAGFVSEMPGSEGLPDLSDLSAKMASGQCLIM